MKKLKLLVLPLLALSLAACGENDGTGGNQQQSGTLDDIVPAEFDFGNFTRAGVLTVLDELQHNTGFSIGFRATTYKDVNADPTYVSDVVVGGKDGYTWAIETTDGVTKGAATKVEGDQFTFYLYENDAWRIVEYDIATGEDLAKEASDFVTEKVDQLIVKEDYLSKIDFTAASGSTSICSRSCYTFNYKGDYYLSIAIDKVLGVMMSFNVTYVDNIEGKTYGERIDVTSFSVVNIEIPAFPQN